MTCGGGETPFIEKGTDSNVRLGWGGRRLFRQHVQIFKPKVDERYSADHLVSHSDMLIRSELCCCNPRKARLSC
jgi:hypothetical protein